MDSPKGKLTKDDAKSILKGFLITLTGAGLSYLLPILESIDWSQYGKWAPVATVVGALVVNMIRKYMTKTEYK